MTADAIVVGAGPNGLAGAVTLAQAGLSVTVLEAAATIGGGTRSGEVTVPGLLHDHCAAVHPMAVASPYLRTLGLERHGLRWEHAETALAHPLDGGHAAVLQRDLAATVRGLGVDGPAWRRLFAPLTAHYDALSEDLMRPLARLPRHPALTGRFGLLAAQPTQWTLRRWRGQAARALFAGIAAHALQPLAAPGSSAIGLMLTAAAHRHGWPVARGGSQAIAHALAARLVELGGTVETGTPFVPCETFPPPARSCSTWLPARQRGCAVRVFPPASAAPTPATGTGSARTRSTWRWREGCHGVPRCAARRAPSTSVEPRRRSRRPNRRRPAGGCPGAPSFWSPSSTSLTPGVQPATSTPSGHMRTSHTATTATRRPPSWTGSSRTDLHWTQIGTHLATSRPNRQVV
ncbi:phytoene desaturase family protein [Streptomyces sp. 900105755]